MEGWEYHKGFTMEKGLEVVRHSLDELSKEYDTLVIEGAGSPAEVNLNDREIVNMRIAELTHMPVILVADIDRGGSFASLVGTIELVGEHRRFIKGVIFNKFRGDRFAPGRTDWFERHGHTGDQGDTLPTMSTQARTRKGGLNGCRAGEALDIAVMVCHGCPAIRMWPGTRRTFGYASWNAGAGNPHPSHATVDH
jgi:hypothetical protein